MLAAKCLLITETGLLFPGIVDNLYWTNITSLCKEVDKTGQNMWGKQFLIVHNRQCKFAIPKRRETHRVSPVVNQPFPWEEFPNHGIGCKLSRAKFCWVEKAEIRGWGSLSSWICRAGHCRKGCCEDRGARNASGGLPQVCSQQLCCACAGKLPLHPLPPKS